MFHMMSFSFTRLPPSHYHAPAFRGGFATNAAIPSPHPFSNTSQSQPYRPPLQRPPSAAILRALCLKSDNLCSPPFGGGRAALSSGAREGSLRAATPVILSTAGADFERSAEENIPTKVPFMQGGGVLP